MDVLLSAQVTEALKQEKRSKAKWQAKYLSAEDQALQAAEDEAAYAAAEAAKAAEKARPGVHNERDASLLRLAMFDDEENLGNSRPSSSRSRPMTAGAARSQREQIRRAVEADVAASRTRSHRITGDLSYPSLVKDIGPSLWQSVNPNYVANSRPSSSMHSAHTYNARTVEKPDKTHHLKLNEFMRHADKCLQLGELPFLSGGMKATPGF